MRYAKQIHHSHVLDEVPNSTREPSDPQRMLTLVSSWALARLSTAMAKKTFSSVSGVMS